MKPVGTKKAVFVDRDGTINIDHGYVGEIERFELIDHALEGLGLLGRNDFLLFLVTNQSGLERGLFTADEMKKLHEHLQKLLKPHGAQFTQFFVSPHRPETPNDVRKPSPKFLLEAAKKYGLDLSHSYMIGDKGETDIQCGINAGCKTILVRTGVGKEWENHPTIKPTRVCDNLLDAAKWILSQQ